ncbi:hypothetical protein RUM43_013001 [Polyplax serrata]|uniref:L-Fucosyltransferase n=1 Tax=Polyplax serrata TaxID=468196 RepID=A0AAN8PCB8_POLSC
MTTIFLRAYSVYLFLLVVTIVLVLEFFTYLIVSRDDVTQEELWNIRNYENAFCGIPFNADKPRKTGNECPTEGIITGIKHRPLHVNMWRFANMLVARKKTGLKIYLPRCMRTVLSETFSNVNFPVLSDIGHCPFNVSLSVNSIFDWTDRKQSVVLDWSYLYTFHIIKNIDEIRQHLQINRALWNLAGFVLENAKKSLSNVTYVGVYIMKTTEIVKQEYDDFYPSVEFFVDAMDYYRRKYSNVSFIVITDKFNFWNRKFGTDVLVLDEKSLLSEGYILAILTRCTHSILGFADLAMWASLLGGGEAILSLSLTENYNSIIQAVPNWKYLPKNTKSKVYNEKDGEWGKI